MVVWSYLVLAIVAEVIATSALKAADGFTKFFPSLLVIGGYGLAFYLLSLVVRTIPLAIAYSIWAGLGNALILVVAYFYYDQKLNLMAIVGIGLIVLGVIIVQLFSKSI
ncbi:MAG: DMT family transporter [Alphaproteobacteria bacterium]